MSKELAVIGADTANQQAGGPSFIENAGMFIGTSVVSGLAGIYNTVVEYAGDETDKLDVSRYLETTDRNWYEYYKENKQLADVAGFVASSFIPGGLAVKGLKAVQMGRAGGAIGRAVQGPLSFALNKREHYLKEGLRQLSEEGGSAYSYINANKLAAMGWGFAENALQNAVFETAAVLAMSQSPVLADSSMSDVLGDIALGTFIGGGFGGAIDAVTTNRMFKSAVLQIGKAQRPFDALSHYSGQGLGIGDEAFGYVDSLLALPKEALATGQNITVKNAFKKGEEFTFGIEKLLKKSLSSAERNALAQVQLTLQKLGTDSTPEVADAVNSMILKMVAEGGEPAVVKQKVGDYLLGLKSVKTLRHDAPINDPDMFYINDAVDLVALEKAGNTVEAFNKLAYSRTPFAKNATAKPYKLVGDPADAKLTMSATTFNDAWEQGFDIAVIGGKARVNPASQIYRQATDPTLIPSRYINTRTTGVSDEVVATWADLLPAGTKASDSLLDDGVIIDGNKTLKLADVVDPEDAFTATARHAWASRLPVAKIAASEVDINDISRMERLLQSGEELPEGLVVRVGDRTLEDASLTTLREELTAVKLQKMQELLDSGVEDMRDIAYRLAVPEQWLERAIANGFEKFTQADNLVDDSWRNLDEFMQRENFIASWASPRSLVELGAVDAKLLEATQTAAAGKGAKYVDTFVTGEIGFWQRLTAQQQMHLNAFHSVVDPEDAARFMDIDVKNARLMADELGVGASMFGASNADYGNYLKLWAQYTGKLTHQLIQNYATKNLEKIQPFIDAFKADKIAGGELGVILTMLRRRSEKFVLVDNKLVVRDATGVDQATGQLFVNGEKLAAWEAANVGKKALFEVESPKVVEFLDTWKQINGERVTKRAVIMNSRGATLNWDPNVIYAPPIDTRKYPFFAFVKVREGHVASNSDVGMITARSAEELNKLTRGLPDNLEAFFKQDTEQYYKIKNEYDSQLALNEPRVNSMLAKAGKLSDHFYEVRPENVLEDFIQYSQNADTALIRHAVDTRYAQTITELKALGKQYTEVATSQMSGTSRFYDKTAVDPFGDYVRTALDISKRSSFPLISQLNEFVDSAGTTAYRILFANTEKAKKGLISWEEAERLGTKYGIGGVYNADNAETIFGIANRPADRNLIRETVSKVNSGLATMGLRLDFANSLVNVISLPIMLGTELASLKGLARDNPEVLGKLSELFTTKTPDGIVAPSYTKLIARAMKNVIGPGGKDLIAKYRASGDVKHVMMEFHEMMGELAINPKLGASGWSKAVDAAIERGAKWTGNNYAEDLTRALSANVMDQLTAPLVAAKKLTLQEAEAYRSVFVNRVNGNYISSQRPISFQGTVGAAVSLFQTYVFNVMQQLTRHIEDRNTRALLTMTGLQGAIYGLNGLPFFEAVNTNLIGNANINDGHRDIYSTVTQLAGKELGDWMMYGTASALPLFGDKSPALYTRGDINPRHITILPVSPLDIPAVAVTQRIVSNIYGIGSKIVAGTDLGPALLEGLEHNGVSRPLAGIAQGIQGYASTSKASLISAASEFDVMTATTRALGAKPMDEAVALNTMFRLQAYKAADLERLSKLGAVVKTKLRGGQSPTEEDMQAFMKSYASAGGNLQNYSAALQRWNRDANTSVVEQMKQFHSSSYAQRLSEIMAGTSLSDYRNTVATGEPPQP